MAFPSAIPQHNSLPTWPSSSWFFLEKVFTTLSKPFPNQPVLSDSVAYSFPLKPWPQCNYALSDFALVFLLPCRAVHSVREGTMSAVLTRGLQDLMQHLTHNGDQQYGVREDCIKNKTEGLLSGSVG